MKIPGVQWPTTIGEALSIQQKLRKMIILEDSPQVAEAELVTGVDVAFPSPGRGVCAAVTLDREGMVVEQVHAATTLKIPYIPGLLAFREGPPVLAALSKLRHEPDILMFDGQGFAHPRRVGIASHIGVLLGKPSIGVAKTVLCGKLEYKPKNLWETVPLVDRDELIGYAMRTSRKAKNPVYISPGHLVGFETSVAIVKNMCQGYKLPEPTRRAHIIAETLKHKLKHGKEDKTKGK
ncbi:MAG: endonuclease V [Methanobacteriota archaeon]|nr:MAG: endonuclease V [Euryarchaeota archaeon]